MKLSICIATYNRPAMLCRVLNSIYAQRPDDDDVEVIVVDDGSEDKDAVRQVCLYCHGVQKFIRVEREPDYRNPSVARNLAYKAAAGDVIIAQSDDVIHQGDAIDGLLDELHPGQFVIGTVYNVDAKTGSQVPCHGGRWFQLTGPEAPHKRCPNPRRPLFFLGALYRRDLYAVGGNDEEFSAPGAEDRWFADCLIRGLRLKAHFTSKAIGHHIHHGRPPGRLTIPSRTLYKYKAQEAFRTRIWQSSGGPWLYVQGKSFNDIRREAREAKEKESCESSSQESTDT